MELGKLRRKYYLASFTLVCGFLGYIASKWTISEVSPASIQTETTKNNFQLTEQWALAAPTKKKLRQALQQHDHLARNAGAIENQRVVVFRSKEAMAAFLSKMGRNIQLLGKIDALNALQISFLTEADLLSILSGEEETGFVFPVNIPDIDKDPQTDASPVGFGLLDWLGIQGDHSSWGKGIKIAILDTGIADHIAFRNSIERINLVPLPADPALLNGHGTSVASTIFSSHPSLPGIAPSATPLSIRIADDTGSSDSFKIAQGIIAAVDAGAKLINISMGGFGKSELVENSLSYARNAGVIVIAPAGNTGLQGVMFPASSSLAIAVGSVDAKNQPMNFSTTGKQIALAAPGYQVAAAYPNAKAVSATGTSFSAPIVTGIIAATMSFNGKQTYSAPIAWSHVQSTLIDVAAHGNDSSTGGGIPDVWAAQNINTRGIYDAAVTSISIEENSKGRFAHATIQNLGTETLLNTSFSLNVNGVNTPANITSLAKRETRVITVSVPKNRSLNIHGQVQLSGNQSDIRPFNDSNSQNFISP